MDTKSVVQAALLIICVGCGSASDSPQTLQSTTQGGGTPTVVATARATVGSIEYRGASRSTMVWANGPGINEHLDLGDLYPHAFLDPEAAGVGAAELWVIGRVGTGTVIRAYTDSNADGVIDPATGTTLVASVARPTVVEAAAFDPDSGALYLLERDTSDVFRATDTNADQRPDTLSQTPFIAGTWSPAEPGPVWLDYTDPETGQASQLPGGISSMATHLIAPTANSVQLMATLAVEIGRATDTNGDGVADVATAEAATAVIDPEIFHTPLVANLDRVTVGGTEGATIELQVVDSTGSVLAVLESGTIADGHLVLELAVGLAEGDLLRAFDTTNSRASETREVHPAAIYLHQPPEPLLVSTDQAATIVLTGVNLDRVTDVSLRQTLGGTQSPLPLTFTVATGGKSVSIEIPVLGDNWDGHAILFCCKEEEQEGGGGGGGGIESKVEYGIVTMAVCKAETGGSSGG